MIKSKYKPTKKFVLKVIDHESGHSHLIGFYDSVLEMSVDCPISHQGADAALMSPVFNPEHSEPIFYEIVNGQRREISDPRIFMEDLGSL